MTLLLTSVNGPAEAGTAVASGADIVDLRGEATPESVRAVLAAIAGRGAVSAGTGEVAGLAALADAGVDYAKVLTRQDEEVVRAAALLAQRTKLLGIMLADYGPDEALIACMAANGFAGVILNTGDQRNLLDALDIAALSGFADTVRAHGLVIGLAGALEPPDIPRLLLIDPDVLAFRFDATTIDGIRAQIPPDQRRARGKPAKADDRPAARTAAGHARPDDLDRIFVHDFVLPVSIGTYARERDKPQNVRFNVEVRIARAGDMPAEMHDVLSYDIITDSIRLIAARGHVALAETLAEQVAAAVLAHPRAAGVTVRVAKLDTGSGSVGVEIARERPAEVATVHPLFKTGESNAGS